MKEPRVLHLLVWAFDTISSAFLWLLNKVDPLDKNIPAKHRALKMD